MCWGSLAAVAASKPHLEHIGGSTPIRIQLLQLLSPIILVLSIRRATACAFHRICSGLRCMHQVLNNGSRAMLRMLRPMPLRFRKLRGNEIASQRLLRCDLLIRVRFELCTMLVQRDSVSECLDCRVRFCERQVARDQADRCYCIPDANEFNVHINRKCAFLSKD